jgi:hypothetical protein
MARLLTLDGDEICYLTEPVIDGTRFRAEVTSYVAARNMLDDAILETDGAHYRVSVDSWGVTLEGPGLVCRVGGLLASRLARPSQ